MQRRTYLLLQRETSLLLQLEQQGKCLLLQREHVCCNKRGVSCCNGSHISSFNRRHVATGDIFPLAAGGMLSGAACDTATVLPRVQAQMLRYVFEHLAPRPELGGCPVGARSFCSAAPSKSTWTLFSSAAIGCGRTPQSSASATVFVNSSDAAVLWLEHFISRCTL